MESAGLKPEGVVLRGGFVVAMDAFRTAAPRDIHLGTDGRITAVLPPRTPVPGRQTSTSSA